MSYSTTQDARRRAFGEAWELIPCKGRQSPQRLFGERGRPVHGGPLHGIRHPQLWRRPDDTSPCLWQSSMSVEFWRHAVDARQTELADILRERGPWHGIVTLEPLVSWHCPGAYVTMLIWRPDLFNAWSKLDLDFVLELPRSIAKLREPALAA